MFIVLQKLKKVKGALKELNKVGCFNLQAAEARVYNNQMIKARQQLHLHPGYASLATAELEAIEEHKMKHADYVSFLSQKAEMEWLRDGDENTRLFHQSLKARKLQNHIFNINDEFGVWHGNNVAHMPRVMAQIVQVGPMLNAYHLAILNAPYTTGEIRKALFSIPESKAPGPDGFGSFFCKDAWGIICDDIVKVVLETLQSGHVLKELNNTSM
ncbi:uncharacterized protein LOC125491786 [Beta vulgaris subsp. vulgaris]|uniref:uncharacterized protein LOC125491786 n=1 Tax=Beta vulgaris subsp. vulgaris TaxID=3555 RepID=UPI002036ACFE|nr:uncharacterized protein LOC125491786 [Beta vulgaris subsp. vulgaris]